MSERVLCWLLYDCVSVYTYKILMWSREERPAEGAGRVGGHLSSSPRPKVEVFQLALPSPSALQRTSPLLSPFKTTSTRQHGS